MTGFPELQNNCGCLALMPLLPLELLMEALFHMSLFFKALCSSVRYRISRGKLLKHPEQMFQYCLNTDSYCGICPVPRGGAAHRKGRSSLHQGVLCSLKVSLNACSNFKCASMAQMSYQPERTITVSYKVNEGCKDAVQVQIHLGSRRCISAADMP